MPPGSGVVLNREKATGLYKIAAGDPVRSRRRAACMSWLLRLLQAAAAGCLAACWLLAQCWRPAFAEVQTQDGGRLHSAVVATDWPPTSCSVCA
eukprot:COSAG01_NODE_240_length_20656_cov_53.398259_2_plen_94_part_00